MGGRLCGQAGNHISWAHSQGHTLEVAKAKNLTSNAPTCSFPQGLCLPGPERRNEGTRGQPDQWH